MITVPNKPPTRPAARRIAIVSEQPGLAEQHWHLCNKCHAGFSTQWRDERGYHTTDRCRHCFATDITSDPQPFVGSEGYTLNQLLGQAGIDMGTCWLGYLGDTLDADLAAYQPHFILALGTAVLRHFKGGKVSTDDWRGSLFLTEIESSGFDGDGIERSLIHEVKCMCIHSMERLRQEASLTGITRMDLKRVAEESRTDHLDVPLDDIAVDLGVDILLAKLRALREAKQPVAVDIEGWVDFVSCIGFADGPNHAFVVPFMKADGTSYWSEEDEVLLWEAVANVLTDPAVPKVLQNYLYDAFVLAWSYGILIRGLSDDIMLKHYELYPEFEKSLGFQVSIYTKHPFYKFERKSDDERVQLTYCGKDCCRTFEINEVLQPKLMPGQMGHYRFNMELLPCLLYMELRGIKFNYEKAQERLAATQKRIWALQDRINREAATGRPVLANLYRCMDESDAAGVVIILTESFCLARRLEKRTVTETTFAPHCWNGKKWVKKGKRLGIEAVAAKVTEGWWQGSNAPGVEGASKPQWWLRPVTKQVERSVAVEVATFEDVKRFAKDSCRDACKQAIRLVDEFVAGRGTPALRGELATLLGIHVKINATNAEGDAQWFLYQHCGLPKQFKKEAGRLTDKLASDDEAILSAYLKSSKLPQKRDRRAIWFLTLRRLVTITKFLTATTDVDSRMRFSFNLVGTPTGRMAAYGSPTGTSDINPQTITKKLRDLYQADDGCDMAQFDLDGSDSYSVAAYCASLGDRTMLDDNLARIKPAKVLALIYQHGASVNRLSRDELKVECKKVDGEGWLYFACKRILHGSNYGMKKNTMSSQILTDSYKLTGKPIYIEPAICERIQEQAFFVRYPGVRRWHDHMARELKEKGFILCCNGFKRNFYGRKDDHSTLKEALAHTPQVLTTWAILNTVLNMWSDGENRRTDGSLRVEPLLLVHDSILAQWQQVDRTFGSAKMKQWFQHKLQINGVEFTIPANGGAGPNWLHQGSEKWAKEGGFDV